VLPESLLEEIGAKFWEMEMPVICYSLPVTSPPFLRPNIVKPLLILFVAAFGITSALAAQSPGQTQLPRLERRAFRIPVRSADPWFLKSILEGQPLVSPELGTIMGLFGAPQQAAGQVNGLLQNGKILVNPTDNSLWFYPN